MRPIAAMRGPWPPTTAPAVGARRRRPDPRRPRASSSGTSVQAATIASAPAAASRSATSAGARAPRRRRRRASPRRSRPSPRAGRRPAAPARGCPRLEGVLVQPRGERAVGRQQADGGGLRQPRARSRPPSSRSGRRTARPAASRTASAKACACCRASPAARRRQPPGPAPSRSAAAPGSGRAQRSRRCGRARSGRCRSARAGGPGRPRGVAATSLAKKSTVASGPMPPITPTVRRAQPPRTSQDDVLVGVQRRRAARVQEQHALTRLRNGPAGPGR
jgi:hypothetical protein